MGTGFRPMGYTRKGNRTFYIHYNSKDQKSIIFGGTNMEVLTILLIFSLGVIMLGGCFIGGIAFVFNMMKKLIGKAFGKDKK